MFPMTVTVHNSAQLNAVLAALQPERVSEGVAAEEKAAVLAPAPEVAAAEGKPTSAERAADKPARGRRTAVAAQAAAPEPSTEPPALQPDTAPAADASSASEPVTYDQVAEAVLAIVKARGRGAAVAVLSALGVSKAPELKAEQYPKALAELEAALEA